jgi:hypothetical protein
MKKNLLGLGTILTTLSHRRRPRSRRRPRWVADQWSARGLVGFAAAIGIGIAAFGGALGQGRAAAARRSRASRVTPTRRTSSSRR